VCLTFEWRTRLVSLHILDGTSTLEGPKASLGHRVSLPTPPGPESTNCPPPFCVTHSDASESEPEPTASSAHRDVGRHAGDSASDHVSVDSESESESESPDSPASHSPLATHPFARGCWAFGELLGDR
jgi:hypothetical protein